MLDVFIEGLVVDLAIPTSEFASGDIWYRWLNDATITRYLDQGVFPNSKQKQEAFFANLEQTKLLLVVQTKEGEPRGIVSLSKIDWRRRSSEFALFLDARVDPRTSPLAALEASALIVEHGVDRIGLERIEAGQHSDLAPWQQRLELIGFRLEGIHRLRFVKGAELSDAVIIAATRNDIDVIRNHRGGRLFDSSDKMLCRIKSLPRKSMRDEVDFFVSVVSERYYSELFRL